jgi:hypothetical protein
MRQSIYLRVSLRVVLSLGFSAFMLACDSGSTNLVNDDGGMHDGDGSIIDGDGSVLDGDGSVVPGPDAAPIGGCNPGGTQCSDCIDNDGDGLVDGFDPECTGASDMLENSFATGISGDNVDAKNQDCFFDGNSGGGDDGCAMPTCCILGLSHDECAARGLGNNFNPATDCPAPSQMCIDYCQPATAPGCDCFGCCHICDGTDCRDIAINPAISPDCTLDTLTDPTKCMVCTPSTVCSGTTCGGETCTLCPGQTSEDLPASCGGTTQCPGSTVCTTSSDCPVAGSFCSAGCCISQIG